jgi:hypothetical protein
MRCAGRHIFYQEYLSTATPVKARAKFARRWTALGSAARILGIEKGRGRAEIVS